MLIVLVYFASGGCVDDVVNNRENHQFTSAIVANFMNGVKVCWVIKRTVFNVYFCSNHSGRNEHNQFERHNEKPRHERQFFQNLDNFYI